MITRNNRSKLYPILIVGIVCFLVAVVLPVSVTQAAPDFWVTRPQSHPESALLMPPRPTTEPIPTFPPRPVPQPTPGPVQPPASDQPLTGAFIELRLRAKLEWDSGYWQRLWTVVQRQDDAGDWRAVEEWQGTFEEVQDGEGTKVWWVAEEDFGYGPFRWMVYDGPGGELLAQSELFYLPSAIGETVVVEVVAGSSAAAGSVAASKPSSTYVPPAGGAVADVSADVDHTPVADVDQARDHGGTWQGNRYTSHASGTWVIQGTYKGQAVQVVLNVKPGDLSRIVVSPDMAAVTAGNPYPFRAEAFDAYGNSLGDVTADTDFTIVESGDGGEWSVNRYVARTAGSWTVRGQYEGITADASLDVEAGRLSYIVVSPDSTATTAGTNQSFRAEAFDAYGNSLGDVTADTSFLIIEWGHGGSWTDNVYTPHTAGAWTVRGTYQGRTADAELAVGAAAPSQIVMSPGATTVTAGETRDYVVEAFDAYGNSLGDVTANTSFGIVEGGHRGGWTGNTYLAHTAGVWTVQGSYAGNMADATLTVRPADLNYIVTSPDRIVVTAGDSHAFAAEAFDAYDNPLGNVTGGTIFSIVESGHNGRWAGKFYTAHTAGQWTVRGLYRGLAAESSLDVQPGALSYVAISPDVETVVAGEAQSFAAEAFDAYGNSLGDVTDDTVFSVVASGQ